MTINVLVTGASGMVGGRLVERLTAAPGVRVTAAYRSRPTVRKDVQSVVVGAIDAETQWQEALVGIDVVVHCAARVHVMGEKADDVALGKFREVNVAGTERLATEAVRAGVRRVVFVSSVKVNGESTSDRRPFAFDDRPAPLDPYGISKWEAEQALRAIAQRDGLEVTVVRPPLVYGPEAKANFLRLMQAVARGAPMPFGAIQNRRSMIFVDNLTDLLSAAVVHPEAAGQTLMCSDGDDLSTRGLIEALARGLEVRPHLISVPQALIRFAGGMLGKSATVDRVLGSLQVDISHTREVLDWHPPVSAGTGVERTAALWKNQHGSGVRDGR